MCYKHIKLAGQQSVWFSLYQIESGNHLKVNMLISEWVDWFYIFVSTIHWLFSLNQVHVRPEHGYDIEEVIDFLNGSLS